PLSTADRHHALVCHGPYNADSFLARGVSRGAVQNLREPPPRICYRLAIHGSDARDLGDRARRTPGLTACPVPPSATSRARAARPPGGASPPRPSPRSAPRWTASRSSTPASATPS